jgi:hypothetical protein
VKPDNWKRFNTAFSDDAEKLHPMYFVDGERIGGSTYLPRMLRFDLMSKTKRLAEKYGMTFGCCREGFSLNSAVCDGSGAFSVKK